MRGTGDAGVREALLARVTHPSEMVREHVQWALAQANDPGEKEPLGIYWYEVLKKDSGPLEWVKHVIDYGGRAGGGMQVTVAKLEGHAYPDLVVGGKSGLFLFHRAVEAVKYPAATAALLKAAALMRERFYAQARRELLRAVAASPEEPTLHVLLAEVYERTGLENLAAAEHDDAEALSVRR